MLYMEMAHVWSKNSYAVKRKVGSLIVKDRMIISDGYNGTPSGFPNICEYAVSPAGIKSEPSSTEDLLRLRADGWQLITYPMVMHAESNAITKLARHGGSAIGATIYITDAPCTECSKLIIQSGIKRVVYDRDYHDRAGRLLLVQAGVQVERLKMKSL